MSKFETFDIMSWDPIYIDTMNLNAMVYIKPTLSLLKFFQKAPANNILVKVSGTQNKDYDNKLVFGTIDKSSDVPNKRDNMFNCTGLYCITMDLVWKGYPLEKGKITFFTGTVEKIVNMIVNPKANDTPINTDNYQSLVKNNVKKTTTDNGIKNNQSSASHIASHPVAYGPAISDHLKPSRTVTNNAKSSNGGNGIMRADNGSDKNSNGGGSNVSIISILLVIVLILLGVIVWNKRTQS